MSDMRAPTLKDVALRAGVHVATASRALNGDQTHLVSELTRARVTSAANALGYRTNAVAQSLRRGTTGAIGVVVADLANPFIVALLRGIEQEANTRNYLPLVAETHDNPSTLRNVVTRLLRNRVDGIILSASQIGDGAFVEQIQRQVPVVLCVRTFEAVDNPESRQLQVLQDDYAGAAAAVHHLIELGHRRIAQLAGPGYISSFVERGRGYYETVQTASDVTDVSLETDALESTVSEGRRLTSDLLRLPERQRPTAIFAHNDLLAVGAIDALKQFGLRCPDDMSIVGYNDVPLIDHIDPPLTTVRLPSFQLGRHAALLAFRALNGEPVPTRRIMLGPELVERKSTRPPVVRIE